MLLKKIAYLDARRTSYPLIRKLSYEPQVKKAEGTKSLRTPSLSSTCPMISPNSSAKLRDMLRDMRNCGTV